MKIHAIPRHRATLHRIYNSLRFFLTSEVRWQAGGMIAVLVLFALGVNGLNVVNSYMGRDLMTAIAHRNQEGFIKYAYLTVGVFAALTAVSVLYYFVQQRLALLWRVFMTRLLTQRYLGDRIYDRIKSSANVDNPDERLSDDINNYTVTTLSFTIMLINGILAAVSFSGVLWTISPLLFAVAVGYAVLGTLSAIYLGKPLVGLNYKQLDREADFRAELVHVRQNTAAIAVVRREGRQAARLMNRIDAIAENYKKIIASTRNLSFFTTGYNWMVQIIPTVIVAPLFIRGDIQFGTITQSGVAFAQLLGAFSLIVNQFQSISTFTAVVARLNDIAEEMDRLAVEKPAIESIEAADRVAYDAVTLTSTTADGVLIRNLTATIQHGAHVQVVGSNESARVALFRATAGVWHSGSGRISRPGLDAILFLPQQPYLPPSTLREALLRTGAEKTIADEQILATLALVGADGVVSRVGGLDVERDWSSVLSLSDQQLLSVGRVLLAQPRFAFLDRVSTTLSSEQMKNCLRRLAEKDITFVLFTEHVIPGEPCDATLDLAADGSWTWNTASAR